MRSVFSSFYFKVIFSGIVFIGGAYIFFFYIPQQKNYRLEDIKELSLASCNIQAQDNYNSSWKGNCPNGDICSLPISVVNVLNEKLKDDKNECLQIYTQVDSESK